MAWLQGAHVACAFAYLGIGWYLQWRAPHRMAAAALAAIAASWAAWSATLVMLHDPGATPSQAALGYNVGVVGWAGIGSLALAVALGFTGRNHLLAKRWVRAALVVPPVLVMCAQWAGGLAERYQWNPWGWGFVWSRSPLVFAFYAYYAGYVTLALYLVLTAARRTREPKVRRYMWLITTTGAIALSGGTVTDVILPWLGIHRIPNIAPMFLVVFFAGVTIAVLRYRALELTPENASTEILAAMREGVLLVDREGSIIDANLAAFELLGESELKRRPLESVLGASSESRVVTVKARELQITTTPVHDPNGTSLGSVCLLRDQTEQKRTASALRELTEQLEARVAQRTGELDVANRDLQAALVMREKVSSMIDSIHLADAARELGEGVAARLVEAFELSGHCRVVLDDEVFLSPGAQLGDQPVTFDIVSSGRQRGRIELHGVELARPEARAAMARIAAEIGLALESISLRVAIAQADRLASIGVLAAGVAHEINNPLTYLSLGLVQIHKQLDQPTIDVERIRTRVTQARDASDRIAKVVRELSAFARDTDEVKPVALRDAVTAAIEITRHQVEHRARLVVAIDTQAIVHGDAGRITQVFVNLLVNAAQATPEGNAEGHSISVTSRDEVDQTVITVSDTGRGIPPEALDRIFDPFFTTKAVTDGTGLGLAISFKIVRSLGGTITVSSPPGQGARFEVRFPRTHDLLARTITPKPALGSGGKRILIVDDDVLVARSLGELLGEHEVSYASSGFGARQRLQLGEHFDLVICDLMMPEVGGSELYEWIQSHRRELAPRILFMSGGAFTAEARAFCEAHADRLLTKPIAAGALESAVARMLAP